MPEACTIGQPTPDDSRGESAGARSWVLMLLLCLAVLGQGPRCLVDPRFSTPTSTLQTFWQALRANDAETAAECLMAGGYTGPYPGSVWFLPATRELRIEAVHALPVMHGRVVVSYEVHYFPLGISEEMSFPIESQLVLQRGEWRISPPLGNVNLPEWRPIHRLTPA